MRDEFEWGELLVNSREHVIFVDLAAEARRQIKCSGFRHRLLKTPETQLRRSAHIIIIISQTLNYWFCVGSNKNKKQKRKGECVGRDNVRA